MKQPQPQHPVIDFLVYFALALIMFGLLAIGIVLMLIFTIVDYAARLPALMRAKRRPE